MNVTKRNIKTVSLIWISQLLCSGAAFVTQMLLAKKVSVLDYGSFSAGFSLVAIFANIAGFGIGSYWLKVFSSEGWRATRWIKSCRIISFFSIVFSVITILLISFFGNYNHVTKSLILLFTSVVISQGLMNNAIPVFQLNQDYKGYSLFYALPHVGRLIIVIILSFFSKNILVFGIGYLVVSIVVMIISTKQISNLYNKNISLHGFTDKDILVDDEKLITTFKNVFPFAMSSIFYLLYYQIDITFITFFKGELAAAPYYLAFTMLSVVYLLPNAIYQGFLLPKMHYWSNNDIDKLKKVYYKGNILMFFLGMVLAVGIYLLVPLFITWAFPIGYTESIPYIKILVICIPIRFVAANSGGVMTTGKLINTKIYIQLAATVFNIIFNLIFIPIYGAFGAAFITVVTEMLLMMFLHKKSINFFKNKEIGI